MLYTIYIYIYIYIQQKVKKNSRHCLTTILQQIRLVVPSSQVELHAINCWVSDTKEGKKRRYDLLKDGLFCRHAIFKVF